MEGLVLASQAMSKGGTIMSTENFIRNYRSEDLPSLVTLINEADTYDKLERTTTLQEMEHEMSFPTVKPETDCFLAWAGDRLVGSADMYVRKGDPEMDKETTVYCWGVVHPEWRRRGIGRRLLEAAYRRGEEYLDEIEIARVHFQCNTRDVEMDRIALYKGFGMKRVRYSVNLARPVNGNLPPVVVRVGYRLRSFDLERDAKEAFQVDNAAFRDHWGHTEGKLEEFLHWMKMPHMRPELWLLAEEEATGKIVGLGLNVIDPDWIAQTGRQEGYLNTLAVLREHRRRGLGTALISKSLRVLRDAGMEAVHLHADTENLTGAMRLYERVGFKTRKTYIAYRKALREG
jgi:mycothiol synthase